MKVQKLDPRKWAIEVVKGWLPHDGKQFLVFKTGEDSYAHAQAKIGSLINIKNLVELNNIVYRLEALELRKRDSSSVVLQLIII